MISFHSIKNANKSQVAIEAHRSLIIDMTPLWTSTPERLANVGPRPKSPDQNANSMSSILDEIAATPSRGLGEASPPSPLQVFNDQYQQRMPKGSYNRSTHTPSTPITALLPPRRTSPSLVDMTESESIQYLAIGQIPARLQRQTTDTSLEEMDWTPSQSSLQRQLFNPTRSTHIQPFSQVPTVPEPNPFRTKIPQAPFSPAHRLRNPPNPPRLRVASEERKENFFKNITERKETLRLGDGTAEADQKRYDGGFTRQTFFPPQPQNEEESRLADLLTGFSLGDPEIAIKKSASQSRTRHAYQGLVLLFAFFLWNQALYHHAEHSYNVMLLVMATCLAIGSRTILDNSVLFEKDKHAITVQTLGLCFGGLECAASSYGILEIMAGRGDCGNCGSLGMLLIGGMLVYEIWFASFGN